MSTNTPRGYRKEPLLSRLAEKFNFLEWLAEKLEMKGEIPTGFLKKCLFAFLLMIIYIFFQIHVETLYRDITKAEREIKEKRASYISHNAEFQFKSKHSQVSQSLENRGLHRNIEPPIKIESEN